MIPGTRLADYGENLDGFSSTYEHVLPGMQGNNIWMVRQLARLRELQGWTAEASSLRAEAKSMADETIASMFGVSADKTRAWWNVVYSTGKSASVHKQSAVARAFLLRLLRDCL